LLCLQARRTSRGYALRNDESTIASIFLAEPLAFLGKISFSIYLVHYLVISVVGTILKVAIHARPVPMSGWDVPMFDVSPFVGDVRRHYPGAASERIASLISSRRISLPR